jgi:hypothetical protein
MSRKMKPKRAPSQVSSSAKTWPRELKIALLAAIPFGIAAALTLSWPSLFPTAPERLVEVVWKHECRCANNWMKSLRAEGFVVRDFELDDTRSQRERWHVPNSIRGCHPASYLGYFLDGHISASTLRRLAREHPQAIGVQQVDTTMPGADGVPKVASSQLLLISSGGSTTPWPSETIESATH